MARSSKPDPPFPVASRCQELREQARKELKGSFLLNQFTRNSPTKSAQLCQRSDELVRRSRNLREKLRRIRDAA